MVDRISIAFRNTPVGTLERSREGFVFRWAASYLETLRSRRVGLLPRGTTAFNAFPPTTAPVNCAQYAAFDGIPPFLRDSLPDAWGSKVMREAFSRLGIANSDDPLMQLAYVGNRGIGGFAFTPILAGGQTDGNAVGAIDGARLAYLASLLISGKEGGSLNDQAALMQISENAGSAGGAHPKCLVGFEQDSKSLVWGADTDALSKLARPYVPAILKLDHPVNAGYERDPLYYRNLTRIEYAYNAMAQAAGLKPPRYTLLRSGTTGEYRYDLVMPRFDRVAGVRHHLLTFSAVAHRPLADKVSSYGDIPGAFRFSPDKPVGLGEIFRRAVFNYAAHVTDDHVKNHAFVFDGNMWAVSPPYDLVYSSKSSHATTIGNADSPLNLQSAPLRDLAEACGIRDAARQGQIIREVVAAVGDWRADAINAAVEPEMIDRVSGDLRSGCDALLRLAIED